MANYTQKAIMQIFENMLREMPFDKITVSAIVARCEISANTFYYHFHDIYDLLEQWMKEKEERYLRMDDFENSWKDRLRTMLSDIRNNRDIAEHIFNGLSRDSLERYVFGSLEIQMLYLIQQKSAGKVLSEGRQKIIAGVCCYSLLGFLIKFMWNDMEADTDETLEQLMDFLEDSIQKSIKKETAIF